MKNKSNWVLIGVVLLLIPFLISKIILRKIQIMLGMTVKDQIKEAAKDGGCSEKMALIIVAQSMHETGNYTSNVFKKANNCFGMKMPSVRTKKWIKGASNIIRTSEGSTPYAEYESSYHSGRDLVEWLKYNKIPLNIETVEQYATVLKQKRYFGDTLTNYINALKKYLH